VLRGAVLRGRTVLQVDEVSDISTHYEERVKFADSARRCLRLRLTDGVNSVAAIESVRVPQLSIHTAPGAKLLLTDVPLSRRILLLSPANCQLLGGAVRALCDAQAAARHADASRVALLPQPLAATPAAAPPARLIAAADDDAIVPDTPPEQAFVRPRQFDDNDEIDINAFLAAENEALHEQKRLRGVSSGETRATAANAIDLNDCDEVDDLVRIVTQVPDSSSDEEAADEVNDEMEPTKHATTTTTTATTTRMIDLCDDDDDDDSGFG
jgi:hypothetical protein